MEKYDLKSGVILGNHDQKLEMGGKKVMYWETEMNSTDRTLSSFFSSQEALPWESS